jgi:hypothetical protein
MKIIKNNHLSLILLVVFSLTHMLQAGLDGRSFFMPRPQGINLAHEMTGWHSFINRCDTKKVYGAFTVTPAYNQSYKSEYIANALFGTNTLQISGSQVMSMNGDATRGSCDLLADYFGLSSQFQSSVQLDPSIKNTSCDFAAYTGFHDWYIKVHAPLVWTQWNLGLSEAITSTHNNTIANYPANYMGTGVVAPGANSFIEAMRGNTRFGDMQEPLRYGKICGNQHKAGLADIETVLGWNFVNRINGFFGMNLRMIIPTGNRPNSEYLFEPIVGNGKHWGAGLGISGRARLWEKDGEQEFSFFGELNGTHLFNSKQTRSFDYEKNGFFSRYMLLKEFDASGNYAGKLVPAINRTTFECSVRSALQVDFAAMFAYTYKNFVFDLGYNAWFRTKEQIKLSCCQSLTPFGIKGVQDTSPLPTPGNNTQSTATIYGILYADRNDPRYIDQNSPVYAGYIEPSSAASTSMLSNKFFTYFGYNAVIDSKRIDPFVGIGIEIEFEGYNDNSTVYLSNTTMSQWGIWIKGGFGF